MVARKPLPSDFAYQAGQQAGISSHSTPPLGPSLSSAATLPALTSHDPTATSENNSASVISGVAELPSDEPVIVNKDQDNDSLSDWADSDDDEDKAPKHHSNDANPSVSQDGQSTNSLTEQQQLPAALRIGSPSPLHIEKRDPKSNAENTPAQSQFVTPMNSVPPPTNMPQTQAPSFHSNNPFLKHMNSDQASPPSQSENNTEAGPAIGQKLPLRQPPFPPLLSQESASGHITSSAQGDTHSWAGQSVSQPAPAGSAHIDYQAKDESIKALESLTSTPGHTNQLETGSKPPSFPTPAIRLDPPSLLDDPIPETSVSGAETGHHPKEEMPRPPVHPTHSSDQQHKLNTAVDVPHSPGPETPGTKARKQRNETYQIKNIRWLDSSSVSGNLRLSPVLTQNANGPCPLLALVNALVLATPSGIETNLIQALKTREQVSLGLLLDAVFDELTSSHERRGGKAKELPDVGRLYSFLITLHTGMNVNPRFVPAKKPPTESLIDHDGPLRIELNSVPKAGTFEDTKELQMYSTFAIPLIHGWLPEPGTEAERAFGRSAPSYEDAQNVQFREEELEHKLQSHDLESLSTEEQNLFLDLSAINNFFSRWPTQLTEHGLIMLNETLKPGDFAILFRNDHFSTIYKEPRSKQLMTLVTDQGYSTHEEIVWESLVDVNGTAGQFFSGDFRSVSHTDNATRQPSGGDNEWTMVQGRGSRRHGGQGHDAPDITGPPRLGSQGQAHARTASEQEDHDLALALQLQEEEEERVRRLNGQSSTDGNANPARNSSVRISSQPEVPPRRGNQATAPQSGRDGTLGDSAPPTYEQAAAGKPFHPPRGHPSNENSPRNRMSSNPQGQQSTSNAGPSEYHYGRSNRRTARQSLIDQIPNNNYYDRRNQYYNGPSRPNYAPNSPDRGDKCIVM